MLHNAPTEVRSALNRLVIACRNDTIALEAAALIVGEPWRKARLMEQSHRRNVFLSDLNASIVALGGMPAPDASYAARLGALIRLFKAALAGNHVGDAYAACARTETKTETAYASALLLDLPTDIRFGVLQQHVEIELDRRELRRLRWDIKNA